MRVAIVGAGISGLSAAYALRDAYQVTVFEASAEAGGHAHTAVVPTTEGELAIDTGFIVYNEPTYPGFTALLKELDVPAEPSDMSFGCSCRACSIEWSSRGLRGFFASRRRALTPSHAGMALDIMRFYRDARAAIAGGPSPATLGDYAASTGENAAARHFALPMAAAIWSTATGEVRDMPFLFFARFMDNHGLIGRGRTLRWRTIRGGSREYVRRLVAALPCGSVRTSSPVDAIERDPEGVTVQTARGCERFDAVIIATHGDSTLRLLRDATDEERAALGSITFTSNRVVLHTDRRLLPKHERAHASWNVATADCRNPEPALTMTYDLTRLQSLPGPERYLVSVNPGDELDGRRVLREYEYSHPRFTPGLLAGQRAIGTLQGCRRTFYAGAYLGNGFHEDGFQAGLRAARLVDSARL